MYRLHDCNENKLCACALCAWMNVCVRVSVWECMCMCVQYVGFKCEPVWLGNGGQFWPVCESVDANKNVFIASRRDWKWSKVNVEHLKRVYGLVNL